MIDVMDKMMVLSAGNQWRLRRFHLFLRTLIGSFVQVIDVMDKIMGLSAGNEWRLRRFH